VTKKLALRDVAVQAATGLANRTMAPGGDLGDLTSSRLKLHVFTRQTGADTSGEIRQETENGFNLMLDCVKGGASKLAAKIAITKKTTNIIQKVNIYRATKGTPPMSVSRVQSFGASKRASLRVVPKLLLYLFLPSC
jgi:hypothetical protein